MCRLRQSLCVAFGFLLAGIGLLLGFYVFPKIVFDKVEDNVKLVNKTDAYERWETLPLPLQFKVYFFNVTNPDEIHKGAKPELKEIGPYVYNEYRHKFNITKNEDTLSYYQNQTFFFNAEASAPNKEDDIITIANLPLMTVIAMAANMTSAVIKRLDKVIPILFHNANNLFLTTTPKKFLFEGIHIACNETKPIEVPFSCGMIKRFKPIHLELQPDGSYIFSLLSFKNNTHDGHYKINSGIKEIDRLGDISSWNDLPELPMWNNNTKSQKCKKLYGTDTTMFPPHRTQLSKVVVFQSDICRTVDLHYYGEIQYKDVNGLRFVVGKDMLASPINSTFHENECYCLNKTAGIMGDDGCLLDGAMELQSCQNVPIVLTFPHFYLAHETYQNGVKGLKPDPSKHEIFVDIEPNSGTVLRGGKRVQFNIFFREVKLVSITKNITETLMPVVWIDEGVELNGENMQLLDDSLFYPMRILTGVYWSLIGVGLVIGFVSMVWCMIFADKQKNLF